MLIFPNQLHNMTQVCQWWFTEGIFNFAQTSHFRKVIFLKIKIIYLLSIIAITHSFPQIKLVLCNQPVHSFCATPQKYLFNAFILIHYFYLIQLFCQQPQWHCSVKLKAVWQTKKNKTKNPARHAQFSNDSAVKSSLK